MDNEVEEIDLIDYLKVLWKRKWTIAGITLFSVAGAVVVSFYLSPLYRVTTIIEPVKEIPQDLTYSIFSKVSEDVFNDAITRGLSLEYFADPEFTVEAIGENKGDMALVRISIEYPDREEGRLVLEELNRIIAMEYIDGLDTTIRNIDNEIARKRIDILQHEREVEDQRLALSAVDIEIGRKELRMEQKSGDIVRLENEIMKNKNRIRLLKLKLEMMDRELISLETRLGMIGEDIRSAAENRKEIQNQRKLLLKDGPKDSEALALLLYSASLQHQQAISYADQLRKEAHALVLEKEKYSIERENIMNHINDLEIDIGGPLPERNAMINNAENASFKGLTAKRVGLTQDAADVTVEIAELETKNKGTLQLKVDDIRTEIRNIGLDIDGLRKKKKNIMNHIEKIRLAEKRIEQDIKDLLLKKEKMQNPVKIVYEPRASMYPVKPNMVRNAGMSFVFSLVFAVFLVFAIEYVERNRDTGRL